MMTKSLRTLPTSKTHKPDNIEKYDNDDDDLLNSEVGPKGLNSNKRPEKHPYHSQDENPKRGRHRRRNTDHRRETVNYSHITEECGKAG